LLQRGPPRFIGSDNDLGFIARKLRDRIEPVVAKTACMAPGSPWETADRKSFDARFRDELPNGEVCHALKEIRILHRRMAKARQNGTATQGFRISDASTGGLISRQLEDRPCIGIETGPRAGGSSAQPSLASLA